jgi:excisionase family DNA binding protein
MTRAGPRKSVIEHDAPLSELQGGEGALVGLVTSKLRGAPDRESEASSADPLGERRGPIRVGTGPIRYMLAMGPGSPTATDASLTVREAADLLQVNTKTVHLMLAQGLPHQRLGKRVIRIRRDDLLAFGRVE